MTGPADWGQSFQALTAEAGQAYARTVRRYSELLDRVGRGELRPDQVQTEFRHYLEEHAADATRELVELSVGLLTGLLHIESRYRDGMLDGLLPAEGPPPAPPAPESIDLTNWFQKLAAYATEQSTRSMARHQQLVDRVAAGEIPPQRVQEEGRRFLEQHAPQFIGDVMTLGLTFVGRLQRSSAALTDGLYDRVLGPDAPAPAAPEPPVCLDLRGHTGTVASATLVVENTRQVAAEVTCEISEFAPRDGGRRFRPVIDVAPARFTLAPGEARDVEVRLPLDAALFSAGADYAATLRISGAGDRELIVQILARAEEASRPAAAGPAPSRAPKSRRSRRARP